MDTIKILGFRYNVDVLMISVIILVMFITARSYLYFKFGIYPMLRKNTKLRIMDNAITIVATVCTFLAGIVR